MSDTGTGPSSRHARVPPSRHGGYKYPRYAESDRGLNQSVAAAA